MGDLWRRDRAGTGDGPRDAHPPLWGLRLFTTYLHDGRARTIEEAILAHDGQARPARDRFAVLPGDTKTRFLAFLHSL